MANGSHAVDFAAPRMAHIRYRTRLMALMGGAVTLGLLPNELLLGRAVDYPLLVAFRLGIAGSLFVGALAISRSPQTRFHALTGALVVFLLFLAGFFLFPLGLLKEPPPILATAYTMTPIAILAIGGIFPLVLTEGALLTTVIIAFFVSAIVGQLMPPSFALAQASWATALLAGAVLWMQKVTLRSLQQTDLAIRTDSLTGTFNRSGVERAGSRLAQERHGLAVLFIDIDGFKPLNDEYGHACGDQVLQHVGATLLRHSRGDDIVGRLGGDEFLFLAPRTGAEGARKLAGRIRAALREDPPRCEEGRPVPVTLSIGVAEGHRDEAYDQIAERADSALRAAKEGGRDQVIVASRNESPRGSSREPSEGAVPADE